MKWIGVVLLAIIGVLAAFVAIEYLTVSIHSLPSFIPGNSGHHLVNGHYRKRGALAAVVSLAAFAAAGYWAYRIRRPKEAAPVAEVPQNSADQMLSRPLAKTEDGSN